ncbi:MAG: hypothetical protein COA79_13805 [Planctomycetota bacterium]|nr:MAG: hypothetical protein COA79_13805 [Planctomycetota bacterium]
MRKFILALTCFLIFNFTYGDNSKSSISFTNKPVVKKKGSGYEITFSISAKSDVEVSILDKNKKVIRHLVAGVLGGSLPPPSPLVIGLNQTIFWNSKDDYKKDVKETEFYVRVRVGSDIKLSGFIGADPYNFGSIDGIASDGNGSVYIIGSRGNSNQTAMTIRVFDTKGNYIKEVLPFPANLKPNDMKDIARWDPEKKSFYPINLRNLNPDFYGQPGNYWANPSFTLVSATDKTGVILSNGNNLFALTTNGAVKGAKFLNRKLGSIHATGGGPNIMAVSPDGEWLYLSGPYSAKTRFGHKYNPKFPPGRVYRLRLNGDGQFEEFVTIPVAHKEGLGGAWRETIKKMGHYVVPKGPVEGIAIDKKGQVFVADRERSCVSVFSKDGKELGRIHLPNAHRIAVHPTNGNIYVSTKTCTSYRFFPCTLYKFNGFKKNSKAVAEYKMPGGGNGNHNFTLVSKGEKTVVWMTGVKGGVMPLEDMGSTFKPLNINFSIRKDVPLDWNRISADYERNEIYISNGTNGMWRFDGKTGVGGQLKVKGKPFFCTDISVGYDGLLYARTGKGYSGALARFDRKLNPVIFSGINSHVLSPYIYSRKGNGYAERGLGVGPDGKTYLSFMFKWVGYAVAGFDETGKPLKGKYIKDTFPAEPKNLKSYPKRMHNVGSITSQLPNENGGIRVDLDGNIYIGIFHRPKNHVAPKGFENDKGYRVSVGSVIKISPEGCSIDPKKLGATNKPIKGLLNCYTGLGPFSSAREAFGKNTCCVCRVPRFDVDRYGRVIMPNAMTNSVLIYDNSGNLIKEFGKYGNFDSQFSNELGPKIKTPEIPLAWPTGAAVTEDNIYINDTYTRRAVRVDKVFDLEEIINFK